MRSLDLTIEIASRSEAGRILCSLGRCAEVSYLVSIGDPDERPPAGYRNVRRKLRLLFADVEVEESGPTEEDISRIIRLADSLKTVGGKVLIHCGAGISRSAAAALILFYSGASSIGVFAKAPMNLHFPSMDSTACNRHRAVLRKSKSCCNPMNVPQPNAVSHPVAFGRTLKKRLSGGSHSNLLRP
jgi:hypothetical protein